ncbi:MAG: hypothetical protein V1861_04970 [Candidatus Micrarchaeota archaeon]
MRTALFTIILAASAFSESGNISTALNNLEQTTQSFLFFISIAFLFFGIILTLCGYMLYLKKVKGQYKSATIYKAAAFGCGGLGLILLFSGLLGIAILLLTPTLIRGLVAPS